MNMIQKAKHFYDYFHGKTFNVCAYVFSRCSYFSYCTDVQHTYTICTILHHRERAMRKCAAYWMPALPMAFYPIFTLLCFISLKTIVVVFCFLFATMLPTESMANQIKFKIISLVPRFHLPHSFALCTHFDEPHNIQRVRIFSLLFRYKLFAI